ncbi:Cobalamin-independent methionine synthase MetE, C-terminal/archaeal [Dillenia turbinata]|uniref:Cobalamin-independent methionine synthase MetE, C-terminal/archaeal n=1 Tax=Dillenia turbinata TaxID=194707 RepID=A0AAN8UJW8_9MAGN
MKLGRGGGGLLGSPSKLSTWIGLSTGPHYQPYVLQSRSTPTCATPTSMTSSNLLLLGPGVITIENSRSDENPPRFREGVKYGAGIGPGVYDIHPPPPYHQQKKL